MRKSISNSSDLNKKKKKKSLNVNAEAASGLEFLSSFFG